MKNILTLSIRLISIFLLSCLLVSCHTISSNPMKTAYLIFNPTSLDISSPVEGTNGYIVLTNSGTAKVTNISFSVVTSSGTGSFAVDASSCTELNAKKQCSISYTAQTPVIGELRVTGKGLGKNISTTLPVSVNTAPYDAMKYKPRIVHENDDSWKIDLGDSISNGDTIDLDKFVILSSDIDNEVTVLTTEDITTINNDLSSTTNPKSGLIIMPGVYDLPSPLHIPNDKIVLGIGIPSLVCTGINGCMTTGNKDVRIASIMFDAGYVSPTGSQDPSNTLLTVGELGEGSGDILQDINCRVARTDPSGSDDSPTAYSCVTVNADGVAGQNLWLWRADHDAISSKHREPIKNLVPWTIDEAQYGLIVNGSHVVMDGLTVDHFQNYQTVWNGADGTINYYLSEMPYVLPDSEYTSSTPVVTCSAPSIATSTEQVCPSLLINSTATAFNGNGLGIYSHIFEPDGGTTSTEGIYADTAIRVNHTSSVTMTHLVDTWLNGVADSGIDMNVKDMNGTTVCGHKINESTRGYACIEFQT